MQCLIIAAGKGSRLWKKGKVKPLVRILGVPLIERAIRSAIQAGVNDFFVVSGYQGEYVRDFLDGLQLRYLQTLREVATQSTSKTLFPIPIDLFQPFMRRDTGE